MRVPIFITSRDRETCLARVVERLERLPGVGPIIIVDNDSVWPPLVDYLATTPHEVVRIGENAGHRAVWVKDVHPELRANGPFVVTDPDVLLDEDCPDDLVDRMLGLLDSYPELVKVGVGLRIDDLPQGTPNAADVVDWESQFWEHETEPGVYEAAVDTTFALYRAGAGPDLSPAVRTGFPYVARHLPWYVDQDHPGPEDIVYRARARQDSTNWHDTSYDAEMTAGLARRRRMLRGQVDHPLLDAWAAEPAPRDEQEFTPRAEAGWSAWNPFSPEQEFCEFVGLLTRVLGPSVVVETGIGQGYTTRRIAAHLLGGVQRCFESDDAIRAGLASLPFFHDGHHALSQSATPEASEFADADLTVLDSEPPTRATELTDWRAAARVGSVLVVHGCSDGQGRILVDELDIPGVFLRNPRGAFVGVHPGPHGPASVLHALEASRLEVQASRLETAEFRLEAEQLGEQLDLATEVAEQARLQLDALRSSLSWRITGPLRYLGKLRRG